MAKRLGLCHIDGRDGIVHDYLTYLLADLKQNVDHLIVLCSGSLLPESLQKLSTLAVDLFVYDRNIDESTAISSFLKHDYGWDQVHQFDELMITNDSCYGPLYPLRQVFTEMEQRNADFWGITNQYPYINQWGTSTVEQHVPYHIQSYFLVVRKNMFHSEDFAWFWDSLEKNISPQDAYLTFEKQFTSFFAERGYTCSSYIDTIELVPIEAEYNLLHTHHHVMELIERYKSPFIKRDFFSIPLIQTLMLSMGADARRVMEYVHSRTNYDVRLIWEHLLRTTDVSDLHDILHLDYILPSQVEASFQSNQQGKKAVVIAHLHYPELVERCFSFLRNIPLEIDLIVTTSSIETEEKIKASMSDLGRLNYQIIKTVNRGREISSFLVGCKEYLMEYEYLCFVHDKKVTRDLGIPKIGQTFMDLLWENTLKSSAYINNILRCFEENPQLGLLAPPPPYHSKYLSSGIESWTRCFAETESLAERLELNCKLSRDKRPFVLGTAFWCRTSAMSALFKYEFKYEDFPQEPLPGDGSMNHAIERVFPYVAQHEGYYSGLVMPVESASLHIVNYRFLFANLVRTLRQGSVLNNYGTAVDIQDLLSTKASDEEFASFYHSHARILLYGTGEIAGRFAEDFLAKGLVFEGFVVSDGRRITKQFHGYPVYELSEVKPTNDTGIVLAISRYNQKQVLPVLNDKGYRDLYSI